MSVRELPESLTTVLDGARDLEAQARGTHRERPAIAATSALLLAAHEAGWQQAELAHHLGMPLATVHKRIANARRAHPEGVSIVVDAPLDRSPARLVVLRLPVEQRAWLTIGEAVSHVDRDRETVRHWLARGALPNTDSTSSGVHLYLRADLDRVMAAPRRGTRQIYPDFAWLLERIAAALVSLTSPLRVGQLGRVSSTFGEAARTAVPGIRPP